MSNSRQSNAPRPGGGPGFNVPPQKAKNFKSTLRRLVLHLKPFSGRILLVMIFAVLGTVFSIIGPKITGKITTAIFEGAMGKLAGNTAGIDFPYIAGIITTLLGLYVLSFIFSSLQNFIMAGVAQKVSFNFRKELSEKVNHLPLKYFDTRTYGEVLSRVTNDVDTINQGLSQSLTQSITSLVTVVGVLVMMLTISVTMTLVALLIIPLSLIVVTVIVKSSQKYYKKQQEFLGHVNGQIEESYAGHTIMKAFNAEERASEEFSKNNDTLYNTAWKSQFLSGIMMPALFFVGNLGYVAVCVLGGYLAARKTIEVGDILAFIQYVRNFTMPMSQMAQIANVLQSTIAAAERVFEFMDEPEEMPDSKTALSPDSIKGNVDFSHVTFGYSPEKIIINDFSANIRESRKIAIVGPTGAGKTTIVKLLMRFYDLNGGQILIDNKDITHFTRNGLRSKIGMVLQDTWLFNGSIMENIRYGRLDATDEEVIEAAKTAHVDHFVRSLPNSYKMELNEEAGNISQGQKQLITIARAILSNPRILILDEATSSVDTRTEVLIQKAMENLMKGRTSFIIAHRLSTIRDADLILVMDQGDIVEQGSHEELLKKGGFYASLYNSQFDAGLVS